MKCIQPKQFYKNYKVKGSNNSKKKLFQIAYY